MYKIVFFILFLLCLNTQAQNAPPPQVNTIVALKSVNTGNFSGSYNYIKVNYGSTKGDGLGGWFWFNPSSSATADDIDVVQPNSGGGRWLRERVDFTGLQTISNNRLLGRYNSGTGDIEQIQIGSGLNLSGLGVLSATGAGTVTFVDFSVFSGISVSGNPITTSGTISLTTSLDGILRGDGSGFTTATIGGGLDFTGGTLNTVAGLNKFNTGSDYTITSSFEHVVFGGGAGDFQTDLLSAGDYIVRAVFSIFNSDIDTELVEAKFYNSESGYVSASTVQLTQQLLITQMVLVAKVSIISSGVIVVDAQSADSASPTVVSTVGALEAVIEWTKIP